MSIYELEYSEKNDRIQPKFELSKLFLFSYWFYKMCDDLNTNTH